MGNLGSHKQGLWEWRRLFSFTYILSSDSLIEFEFNANVEVHEDKNREKYFRSGALLFAFPIEAIEESGREYAHGFIDFTYRAKNTCIYEFYQNHNAVYHDGKITLNLKKAQSQKIEEVELVPIGKTF